MNVFLKAVKPANAPKALGPYSPAVKLGDSLKPGNRRGRRNDNRRADSPGHEEHQGCSCGHGA